MKTKIIGILWGLLLSTAVSATDVPCVNPTCPSTVLGLGLVISGTKFTTSGCSVSATVGSPVAGKITSGTTGTCTVVITMNGAIGLTAPNGWHCDAVEETTGVKLNQTADSTTGCTVTGTTTSGDIINFSATAF